MVANNMEEFKAFFVRVFLIKLVVLSLPKFLVVCVPKNLDGRCVSHEYTFMVEFRLISESFFSSLAKGKKLYIYSSTFSKHYFHRTSTV